MKITKVNKLTPKKLIAFDLDGTLTESKSKMDSEMASLIKQLLQSKKVAIVGGGKYSLFKTQFISQLKVPKEILKNLYLFPTTATSFYQYDGSWKNVYSLQLSPEERKLIKQTFVRVFKELDYNHPKKVYGKIIEDRGTQVTFSALGQDIVAILGKQGIILKDKWKAEHTSTKMKIAKLMSKYLPELEVRAAGHTSVDITKKGIDKSYGLRQIEKYAKVKIKDMLFIGDAIFPGGNDYAVTKTAVDYFAVKGPEETKAIIRAILKM